MRWRIGLLAILLGALVLGVGGAGAAATFTDPEGDALGGAADFTQVVVSNDSDGNITFSTTIPNRASFSADDFFVIVLNTDKNVSTGTSGVDFLIGVDSTGPLLFRGDGTTFVSTPMTTLRSADGGKTITVNRSELGNTTGFGFLVFSGLGSSNSAGDDVPNSGALEYDLVIIDTLSAKFSPKKPKAGKRFRVSSTQLGLEGGATVKPDKITCVARLGGKRLAGTGCSWKIPKSGKRKLLVIVITASYQGVSETFTPWRFRVG